MTGGPQKSSGDTLRAFIVGVVAVGSLWAVFSDQPNVPPPQQARAVQQVESIQGLSDLPLVDHVAQPVPPQIKKETHTKPSPSTAPATTVDTGLSNDNYYTNSVGNTVHSPAYSDTVPAGATAQCRDGTYSFSQSRRGTCSHHGGVARWL